MVSRATDNRRYCTISTCINKVYLAMGIYEMLEVVVTQFCRKGTDDLRNSVRIEHEFWEHSRKTARGASSPANPALHMPEL